jgi:signal transduction histidine kinase
VSLIGKQSSSIFNILENLLAWANSQQNNITIQLKQQQLINVVKNNVTLLEEMALQKHIDIKNNINPELSVIFDKNLISTVVRNLISNAIKFTPENGEIIIEAHKIKSLTTVTISDNGVGIPPEHIDHIFDNNSHYSTFGTASEKGSGLGLRLCRDFVKMHGGEIWIEKEVKKGSTFKFTLPHLKNKL